MLTKRIIPCLDVKDGKVVKGINFVGLKEVGDPITLAKEYYEQGADELVFLDITATHEQRDTMVQVVQEVASEIYIPFTVGGGLCSIEDIKRMLRAGADIVLAVDAKKRDDGSGWNVVIHGGRIDTGMDLLEWVQKGVELGAGEILLTSMDTDGVKQGYDLEMLEAVRQVVNVPIIASGGCGSLDHFAQVFEKDCADAALAASLFHYGELRVQDVKMYLKQKGIPVRL